MQYSKDICCRYLNLPHIPKHIINNISKFYANPTNISIARDSASEYVKPNDPDNPDNIPYAWTDLNNEILNEWCQNNICEDMYFAFQIIQGKNGNLKMHKDKGTRQKLIYLVETGGENVVTNFYDDDKKTKKQSIVIEPNRWHIMDVTQFHEVCGIEKNKTRLSITGRVFPG